MRKKEKTLIDKEGNDEKVKIGRGNLNIIRYGRQVKKTQKFGTHRIISHWYIYIYVINVI